jgi:hypothetical protein
MSERRFALVDFTYTCKTGRLRLYEAGRTHLLPRAVAHAATKRDLVARQRPPHWTAPSIFRPPEVLTEVELIEAEAELKALQRHALEVVDPETGDSRAADLLDGSNAAITLIT